MKWHNTYNIQLNSTILTPFVEKKRKRKKNLRPSIYFYSSTKFDHYRSSLHFSIQKKRKEKGQTAQIRRDLTWQWLIFQYETHGLKIKWFVKKKSFGSNKHTIVHQICLFSSIWQVCFHTWLEFRLACRRSRLIQLLNISSCGW